MSMYDLPFFPVSGGTGAEAGKDGVSPTITVTKTTDGNRLTIVDAVGTKTVDIPNGADGKSAFELAKEAGYTGTESDFATKLLQESPTKVSQLENDNDYAPRSELPKLFEITITANGDTYTASHYYADIKAAYDNGQVPVAKVNAHVFPLTSIGARDTIGVSFSKLNGSSYEIFYITGTGVSKSIYELAYTDDVASIASREHLPIYLYTSSNGDDSYTITKYFDGQTFGTDEPMKKAYGGYLAGKNVFIVLGEDGIDGIFPLIMAESETNLTFGACIGHANMCISVANDTAYCSIWQVPEALPNPSALIINNQRYDGSGEVNITISNKSAYDYAKDGGYTGTEEEFTELLVNTVDKRYIKLGIHTDGLLYLFINDEPVGDGIEINV